MPDTILGLNLGAVTVTAVLVTRSFKGQVQVVKTFSCPLTVETDTATALEALFADPDFLNAPCIVSLPAEACHFRPMVLPFKEPGKIRQALPFELEPLLHEPLEETSFDYLVTASAEQTELLVAVVGKDLIEGWSRVLHDKVRRLVLMDVAPVALALQLCRDEAFAASGLLLDIEASAARAVFIQRGNIREIRTFPIVNDPHLPETVEEDSIASSDAQDGAGGIATTVNGRFENAGFHRFLDELSHTLDGLLWRGEMEKPLAKIFLTGSGALDEDATAEISRILAIPTEKADLAGLKHVHLDDKVRPQWEPVLMNQALALAIRKTNKSGGFAFDPRRLGSQNGLTGLMGQLKGAAVALGVILALGGVNAALDYQIDSRRLDAVKKEVKSVFKQSAPEVTQIVDPVQQLRVKIAEAKKAGASMGEIHAGITALDILREVSTLAPTSAELLVTTLNLDSGQVTLKGEAKSFDAVDAIKRELTRSQYLKSIVIGQSSQSKQGNKVEFEMRMSVRGQS